MENEDAAQPIGGTSLEALLTAIVSKSASVLFRVREPRQGAILQGHTVD